MEERARVPSLELLAYMFKYIVGRKSVLGETSVMVMGETSVMGETTFVGRGQGSSSSNTTVQIKFKLKNGHLNYYSSHLHNYIIDLL